jgi:hypothetical protein
MVVLYMYMTLSIQIFAMESVSESGKWVVVMGNEGIYQEEKNGFSSERSMTKMGLSYRASRKLYVREKV